MFHSTRSGFARLAALALALSAVPLLATWVDWRPAAPQPLSLEGWPTPPGGAWERSDQIVVGGLHRRSMSCTGATSCAPRK